MNSTHHASPSAFKARRSTKTYLLPASLALLAFGLSSLDSQTQGQTSENSQALRTGLARFPNADTNKDGVLTTDEANAHLQIIGPRLIKQNPKLDANHDGSLSLSELLAFRRKNQANKTAVPKSSRPAVAPKGGERFVYKQVDGAQLPLYVYGHDSATEKPAIVFFFGGGWTGGSPSQFEMQCKHLAARGMVAATVEYRVSSRHQIKVEDCVEDAKSAMRWIRGNAKKLGIDPNRIASGGGSAGGHLAACTALIEDFNAVTDDVDVSPLPNAMVLFNPALAVAPDNRMTPAQRQRAEDAASKTRTSMQNVSPLNFASAKQPPMIMFFGTDDKLLPGAQLFMQDSEKAGNACKLVTYEGQDHGFFNRDKYRELTIAEMDDFLVQLGWLDAP